MWKRIKLNDFLETSRCCVIVGAVSGVPVGWRIHFTYTVKSIADNGFVVKGTYYTLSAFA
mgnify:CR=1 FL=1